jgi:hypothetical protein
VKFPSRIFPGASLTFAYRFHLIAPEEYKNSPSEVEGKFPLKTKYWGRHE